MNISYDSEKDSLCFSKGQECTTIFNISEFWIEMLKSKVHEQTFSHILQGKKVVEVRNNFSYGREPCCDVYSGNRAEIKVVLYCNVISIQALFSMQERCLTYLCWDDDYAQELDDAKQYLKIHIKADQIAQLLPSNIAKDSLDHFMRQLVKFPKKETGNLKDWDTSIAFDQETKILTISSGQQYSSLKQIEPEYFHLDKSVSKDKYHGDFFTIDNEDTGYLREIDPSDYGDEGTVYFNKNHLRIYCYKDIVSITFTLLSNRKSYKTNNLNPHDDNFAVEPYVSERSVNLYLEIDEYEKIFLKGLPDYKIKKFRKQLNRLTNYHLGQPDKKIVVGSELAKGLPKKEIPRTFDEPKKSMVIKSSIKAVRYDVVGGVLFCIFLISIVIFFTNL